MQLCLPLEPFLQLESSEVAEIQVTGACPSTCHLLRSTANNIFRLDSFLWFSDNDKGPLSNNTNRIKITFSSLHTSKRL